LDPFATGLLLVLLGRATRLAPFVRDEPKEYEALIRFGVETDSDDVTGAPQRTAPPPSAEAVRDAIARLTGTIEQTPPSFSAKHVSGTRAYRLARRGVATELPPVQVHVASWEVLAQTADRIRARIVCSAGTYIRALARDLGRLTKSAAHCAELRRTRCGPFAVSDAVLPDDVSVRHVRPALAAVPQLPTQHVDAATAGDVVHGRPTAATLSGQWAALVRDDGELLAVAERHGEAWQPRVVLAVQ
jgi:tRNA pseudouridine55 synthase